jgi:c-di-GMP-binding flagellar brake protein YcgR
MRILPKIGAALLVAIALLAAVDRPLQAETRADRVRKFQGSLEEEVVRDSGKPLPPEAQKAFTAEAALLAALLIAALVGIQQVISRIAARRREAESVTRYLTEQLMTPAAVRDHLARMVEERVPLSVWIDDHFIRFTSHPDSLSDDRRNLVVLPLAPAAGNDMLRASHAIRVEYLYQKVPYHFDSRWSGEESDRGSFVHRLAIPGEIGFTQRRDVYRVDPPLSAAISCRIPGADQPGMNVLDLSTGGFAVATSNRFRPGEEIPAFRLEGGTLLPIEGAARCVYEMSLSESKSRFRYRYGFEFGRLGDGCERRLLIYISKLQLTELSKRREMES